MEKLVIDSSVAVKWFFDEVFSSEARKLLAAYENGSIELLAPDLIFAEVGNILWKKEILQGLEVDDAESIVEELSRFPFVITTSAVLLSDAYRLASEHRRTVYDSLYLALSLREECRFVTADDRLTNALRPTFPNVTSVSAWS